MRILIIANPIVGIRKEKKTVIDVISADIQANGGTVDITYIMKPGMGMIRSSRAVLEGYDAVYAAGGDGTINEVASGLVGKNIPLGIIPLGTGNGFARGLGIPLDPKAVSTVLSRRKIRTIDTGLIAQRHFFAVAGLGFDAFIARDFNERRGAKTSVAGYVKMAIRNYFLKSPETLQLNFDGNKITRRLFALTICNTSQYGSGAIIAPQADPESGSLVAVLIPKIGMFKALFSIRKLFDGSIASLSDIEYVSFKKLIVKRERNDIFQVDGETQHGGKNIEVSVLPKSLNVYVP